VLTKSHDLQEVGLVEIAAGRCPPLGQSIPRQSKDEVAGSLCGEELVEYPCHTTNRLECRKVVRILDRGAENELGNPATILLECRMVVCNLV